MATPYYSPTPLPYSPIRPPTARNPIGYNNTNDPRKLAQNQRQIVQGQGDALIANDTDLANQYLDQSQGTQQYLNPIESTLAAGGGGYNPEETAAIRLSPEEKQNLITSAGISAGTGTAASVAAADRAAAASGGNPMALATYRARAAQTQGANAGDAMTKARVAAKGLESQGAQTTGAARLGQQKEGLDYYSGLQGQQNQSGLAAQGLAQGAYGTTVGGTGNAAELGLKASQTPTMTDKLIGAGSAVLGALADGTPDYLGDEGSDAVLGEDGPELIVENAGQVPRQQEYMADGGSGEVGEEGSALPPMGATSEGDAGARPWRDQATQILNNYLKSSQQTAVAPPGAAPAWNPVDTYKTAGSMIGSAIGKGLSYLADGDIGEEFMDARGGGIGAPPKVITQPTRVHLAPGDQVIPLSYRPKAKIRPSAALPAMGMGR